MPSGTVYASAFNRFSISHSFRKCPGERERAEQWQRRCFFKRKKQAEVKFRSITTTCPSSLTTRLQSMINRYHRLPSTFNLSSFCVPPLLPKCGKLHRTSSPCLFSSAQVLLAPSPESIMHGGHWIGNRCGVVSLASHHFSCLCDVITAPQGSATRSVANAFPFPDDRDRWTAP